MCGSLSPRLISTLYLLMDRVLRRGWYPLAYPCQKGAQTLLPRAPQRSYRERLSALTESGLAFIPRASQHSYRGRLGVLTESVFGVVVCVLQPPRKRGLHRERSESRRPGVYQLVVSRMEWRGGA